MAKWKQPSATSLAAGRLNHDTETWQVLGKFFLFCELQTLQNIENEWKKDTGDMVQEQVGQLMTGWQ